MDKSQHPEQEETAMRNSDRFLEAFNRIEKYLRKRTRSERWEGFYQLIRKASQFIPAVREYGDDLKEFADLRNAIVHERTDGRVIAEPHEWVVNKIEKLADLILRPPKVIPHFQRRVLSLSDREPIASAIKAMYEHDYSQIPIVGNGTFAGLLTSNTIVRWLGARSNRGTVGPNQMETPIADVLRYSEYADNYRFVSRDTTLFEVLEYFQDYEQKGKRLDALLITHHGKSTESFLGIITVWDFPRVYQSLKIDPDMR